MQLLLLIISLVLVLATVSAFRTPFNRAMRTSTIFASDGAAETVTLKTKLQQDMKAALLGKQKDKLAAVRSIQAEVKQVEVDDQIESASDEKIISIISKMIKQRKESIKSFIDGNRADLAEKEQQEIDFISSYLPEQLGQAEIMKMVDEVIAKVGATTVKDMGKIMGELRSVLAGKADMGEVGELIKKRLGGAK